MDLMQPPLMPRETPRYEPRDLGQGLAFDAISIGDSAHFFAEATADLQTGFQARRFLQATLADIRDARKSIIRTATVGLKETEVPHPHLAIAILTRDNKITFATTGEPIMLFLVHKETNAVTGYDLAQAINPQTTNQNSFAAQIGTVDLERLKLNHNAYVVIGCPNLAIITNGAEKFARRFGPENTTKINDILKVVHTISTEERILFPHPGQGTDHSSVAMQATTYLRKKASVIGMIPNLYGPQSVEIDNMIKNIVGRNFESAAKAKHFMDKPRAFLAAISAPVTNLFTKEIRIKKMGVENIKAIVPQPVVAVPPQSASTVSSRAAGMKRLSRMGSSLFASISSLSTRRLFAIAGALGATLLALVGIKVIDGIQSANDAAFDSGYKAGAAAQNQVIATAELVKPTSIKIVVKGAKGEITHTLVCNREKDDSMVASSSWLDTKGLPHIDIVVQQLGLSRTAVGTDNNAVLTAALAAKAGTPDTLTSSQHTLVEVCGQALNVVKNFKAGDYSGPENYAWLETRGIFLRSVFATNPRNAVPLDPKNITLSFSGASQLNR